MSGLFVHRNLLLGIVSKRALVFSSNLLAKLQKGRGNSVVKELGRLTAAQIDTEPYLPGQLFIHKLFPYRGIVLCSFACPVEEKLPNSSSGDSVVITQKSLFYQILVHSGDWKNMHFPVDITSYLEDAGSMHAEKALTVIFGMDCVAHDEIIPFRTQSIRPITHDLFRGLFECTAVEDNDFVFGIRKEPSFLISQNSRYVLKQLRPHSVYRETTDGIRVTVITFYLGLNTVGGLQKHWWRYVIRLENLEPCSIIVRSREMKVYSLSNMQQQRAPNIAGGLGQTVPDFTLDTIFFAHLRRLKNSHELHCQALRTEYLSTEVHLFIKEVTYISKQNPRLTPEEPAFQYSGTVGVAVDKGSYAWGNFTMEREEDRTSFLVRVPTFRLEYDSSLTPEKTEQLS